MKITTLTVSLFCSCSVAYAGTCQDIIVPAYFAPQQGSPWDIMLGTHSENQFVVMNPNHGPGTAVSSDYATKVLQVQNAGLLVLGYVHTRVSPTASSLRPIEDVKTEIDAYHYWYQVDGIFLDEANTGLGDLGYYQELVTHVGTTMNGSDIVLNHGAHPDKAYAQIDTKGRAQLTLVTFEGQYSDYVNLSVPSWAAKYDSSLFAHLVYNTVSEANMENAVSLSNKRNAGYIYVTDDYLSGTAPNQVLNPWDTLTSYYTSLVEQLIGVPGRLSCSLKKHRR